jgi:predicted permease
MSWRRFFRRKRWDDERARELLAHLDIEVEDNLARGMSPDDARQAAYRKLGNPTLVREEIYGMNSIGWLDLAWQDVKYAFRVLGKSPSFTIVALTSLALGIGANAAIFQLINAVTLRALPLPHADRVVEMRIDSHGKGFTGNFQGGAARMSYPLFEQLSHAQGKLGRVFAWGNGGFDLADGGESQPARGLWVSGALFDIAGVRPATGRLIAPSDDQPGCGTPAVVLSYPFWKLKFGGDPAVAGKTLTLNGTQFVVSGVTEPSFFGFDVGRAFDVAIPMCSEPLIRRQSALKKGDVWWLSVMSRLNDGQTVANVSAEIAAMSPAIFAATVPASYRDSDAANYKAFTFSAVDAATGVSQLRKTYAQPLTLLLAIAGMVLLIACGNLANLMLARASVRQNEMALRLAIGASRRRLIRQLMVESLVLAVGGAIAGSLIAGGLSRLLVQFLDNPTGRRVFVDLGMDWMVLGFTAGLAAITCVLFGLAPAFRATRTHPAQVMRASGRGMTDGRDRFNLRRVLVVGQLALSLVLVTGALLFGGTLKNLSSVDTGFNPYGVTDLDIDYRHAGVPPDQQLLFQQELVKKVAGIRGVTSAASVVVIPLSGNGWNDTLVVDGKEMTPYPNITRVGPAYFDVMKMPIIAGRNFADTDTLNAPKVAIVTEAFGKAYFNNPAPIGREFHIATRPGDPDPAYTVIGVTHDIKYSELSETAGPVMFFPHSQEPEPGADMSIVFRASRDVNAEITQLVRSVHPRILVSFSKVDQIIYGSLVREKLMATLSGFFGVIAAMLAAVGLYGVMSYLVERRRMEIGIRLALGADNREVVWMFMRESSWLLATGLAVGIGLAYFAAKSAATLLFGLTPRDPLPFALATLLLAFVAMLAAFIPARRASRQSPTTALRG